MAISTLMLAAFTASVVGTVQCGEPNKHLRAIKEHTPDADDDFPEAEFSNRMHRVAGGTSSMIENVSPTPFLSVPKEQFDALSNHHLASSRLANFRRARATSFLQGSADGNQTADAFEDAYTDSVSKLQKHSSQYLANIDIGTRLSEACGNNSDVTKAPYRSPSELQGKSSMVELGTCYSTASAIQEMVLDTGSGNTWFKYDTSKSVTYKQLPGPVDTIHFATAEVSGRPGTDDIHIGDGMTIKGQTIGVIETEKGDVFRQVDMDGILGLAFPSMAAHEGTSLVFDSLLEQGQVKKPMFSFYLSRNSPASNVISWGGVVRDLVKGEFMHFPVVDPFYWSLDLLSLSIGGKEILPGVHLQKALATAPAALVEQGLDFVPAADPKKKEYRLLVDTGTTYFTASGAPSTEPGVSLIQKVMTMLPAAPCDQVTHKTHPDLTFVVRDTKGQDRELSFTNEEYMVVSPDGKRCNTAFMEVNLHKTHSKDGAFLWGQVPLQKYSAAFKRDPDNQEKDATVSLAVSKQDTDADKIVAEATKSKQALMIGGDAVGAEAAAAA